MSRHKLTTREMLTGVRNALANPKTPVNLRPSLKKREEFLSEVLLEELDEKATTSKKKRWWE